MLFKRYFDSMIKSIKKKLACGEQSRTVFVGMSGGVDSSVSAALLKKQGYDVVGVFIRTWHPDFLKCNEEEERRDAMRVATHLNIPFLTFDLEDVYKKEVADYMISEYKAGRTPNPDVMCNKEVKFGAFLKKAISMGADFVATGHYAQITNHIAHNIKHKKQKIKYKNVTCYELCVSCDKSKDQAYFLWTLKQEQLSKILFPVGHLNKTEVRKLAKKFKLPVAEKKDSQGICFLGAVDLKDFLKHYIKEKRGEVILVPSEVEEKKKNNVIGWHTGVVFHTLGERHGFTITKKSPNDGAYYVVGKDIKKNILYVSQNRNFTPSLVKEGVGGGNSKNHHLALKGTPPQKGGEEIKLKNINWISGVPKESKSYKVQIRYHGEFLPCKIKITGKSTAEVIFQKPVLVASGQSCVFYDKDICLGGGVVI
jgi:tRNA-specific 2-thiouridylase